MLAYTQRPKSAISLLFLVAVTFLVLRHWRNASSTSLRPNLSSLHPVNATRRPPALPVHRPAGHVGSPFSGSTCVGIGAYEDTRCILRNVCVTLGPMIDPDHNPDKTNSAFHVAYHQPEEIYGREIPTYWTENKSKQMPWARVDRANALSPTFVKGAIPDDAWWSPARTTVLSEAWWPSNWGHALGDDFFPIYRLAKSLSRWDRADLGVIFDPSCRDRGGAGEAAEGCEHHEEISELLLDRPVETRLSAIWPSNGAPLCFQELLVGTTKLAMDDASAGDWPDFVGEVKAHLGLDPAFTPSSQRIVIFLKNGRRTFTNYHDLQAHLARRFGVPVDLVDPAALTVPEQIHELATATVIISPPGGISFSAMFLSRGASAIFADYWDVRSNSSVSMELYIYTYQNDLTPFQYPVEFADLSWDPDLVWYGDKAPGNEWVLVRNWANTTINLERMEAYAFGALMQAEVAMYLPANSFLLSPPDGLEPILDPRKLQVN